MPCARRRCATPLMPRVGPPKVVMMRSIWAILVALLALVPTDAAGQWKVGGETLPDTAWRKHEGAFGAWLVVSSEPRALVREWDDPERTTPPVVREARFVIPEREFGLVVLFTNCAAGPDGNCDVTVDYRILTPDREVAVERRGLTVWRAKPPSADRLELGQCLWATSAEESDPVGTYFFQATVTDHVTKRQITLEKPVELKTAPPGK